MFSLLVAMVRLACCPHGVAMKQTITVLGATGKTGRRVAERLRAAGHAVRAASRTSATRFDWADPSTWAPAVTGADALYLVPPDPGTPVDAFVDLVSSAAVRTIVLLSARAPGQSGDDHLLQVERAVRAAPVSWTILRPSWFDQNFDEGFFAPGVAAGTLRLPVGGGREPFIDADDIAEVAVVALTRAGHEGRTYELSGPEPLSFARAVELLAAAAGRALELVDVTRAAFAGELAAGGGPTEQIALANHLFAAIRRGENDHLSDGVQLALGRAPRTFAEYAARVGPALAAGAG